ncbi:MAG: CDP-glycerol glycerophosphotransferase family protein, partial [Propionicimonas sp.]|nr:CDP-glycerol glycerophosphotransferase family protein [Propionicimonas sp.]
DYAERYPDMVVPFIREENLGPTRNLVDLCQRATSPYIALCEGDDYWVDPLKLQKQVDYMEAHPKLKASSTRTRVQMSENSHLTSWYKRQPDGEYYFPDSQPGYRGQRLFKPADILQHVLCHTSSLFYRWNYDVDIPEWYYRGHIGDWSLLLMQTGHTRVGYIPEVTSVYRVNESSTHFDADRTTHFLRTWPAQISALVGFRDYAAEHFKKSYPLGAVQAKIELETANYLTAALKIGDLQVVSEFMATFPEAARIGLSAYLSSYWDRRRLVRELTWRGYVKAIRQPRNLAKIGRFTRHLLKNQDRRSRVKRKLGNFKRFVIYWLYSLTSKKPNLWVFTSFQTRGYLDNSRHLFEYVCEHHPEIDAVWLTKDDDTVDKLRSSGYRAHLAESREAGRVMKRASLAFTDHFRQSDYAGVAGFNHGLKTVQLWHGVGIKYMGDLRNTAVSGVRRSADILPCSSDGLFTKLTRRVRYLRYARSRELMEEYFGFVEPGPQTKWTADDWKVPPQNRIPAGYPRSAPLYGSSVDNVEPRVLYAPTYRWDKAAEIELVRKLSSAIPLIDQRMTSVNGRMTVRLHPHTWRDYGALLSPVLRQASRVELDESPDISDSLGSYSVVITDYSSIAFDFLLLDRPCVFFCYDLAEYERKEVSLAYDYNEYSPGTKAHTWEETLDAVAAYLVDPSRDQEWRQRILPTFWDPRFTGPDSAERIVVFLKERLGIQDGTAEGSHDR